MMMAISCWSSAFLDDEHQLEPASSKKEWGLVRGLSEASGIWEPFEHPRISSEAEPRRTSHDDVRSRHLPLGLQIPCPDVQEAPKP